MSRKERLKYFRAGIKEGYKLAMGDIRYQLKEMGCDRAVEYGNTFADIEIYEPSVEEDCGADLKAIADVETIEHYKPIYDIEQPLVEEI